MLVEGILVSLGIYAWRRVYAKPQMTRVIQETYSSAMENLSDPVSLSRLAVTYRGCGFESQASDLQRRADLLSMPREKREQCRLIFERAMESETASPELLEEMACGFEAMTATGRARSLRRRAEERRAEILEEQGAETLESS